MTGKIVGISLDGISAAWHIRSRIFHELVSAAEETRALRTDQDLRSILDEEYYRSRPVVRERLLDCVRGAFTLAKKRKLLEKLKGKTRSARVEVVKVGNKFSRVLDGTCQYNQSVLAGSHGKRWIARIEKIRCFEEPTVALVEMVEEEKGDVCFEDEMAAVDSGGFTGSSEALHSASDTGASCGRVQSELQLPRGRSWSDRSAQGGMMRWLKRSKAPSPPTKKNQRKESRFLQNLN